MKTTENNSIRKNAIDRIKNIALVSCLLLIAILAVVIFMLSCSKSSNNNHSPGKSGENEARFLSGTVIAGLDVSGLTTAEASRALDDINERLKNEYSAHLNYKERSFLLDNGKINVETNMDDVLKEALHHGQREYTIDALPVDDARLNMALDNIASDLNSPAEPSRLVGIDSLGTVETMQNNERFALTMSKEGVSVDKEATKALILSGATVIDVAVSISPAVDNTEKLPERLAVFYTSYNSAALSAEGRVNNIKKAAKLIDGSVVEAGEEFSCNAALGERLEERGWSKGTAFASGGRETKQQFGGGICQVSTTLYNCALLSGLETVERHGHSRRVSYIEGGRDASLVWGASDLIIRNNTRSRIHIFMWVDDDKKRLFCEIYGEKSNDYDCIEIVSELIERIEPAEPEFEINENLKAGECVLVRSAITGSIYKTYRIYKKLGKEIKKELVDETTYVMLPAIYAVPPAKESP